LQATTVFKKASEQIQIDIEKNIRNIVADKKVEKELYNNIFE